MARKASQSPMLRVIATLTVLPPPATAGEYSRWTARGSPMYDLRAVALVAAGDLVRVRPRLRRRRIGLGLALGAGAGAGLGLP